MDLLPKVPLLQSRNFSHTDPVPLHHCHIYNSQTDFFIFYISSRAVPSQDQTLYSSIEKQGPSFSSKYLEKLLNILFPRSIFLLIVTNLVRKWCKTKGTALQIILQIFKMVQLHQKSSSFSTGTGVGSVNWGTVTPSDLPTGNPGLPRRRRCCRRRPTSSSCRSQSPTCLWPSSSCPGASTCWWDLRQSLEKWVNLFCIKCQLGPFRCCWLLHQLKSYFGCLPQGLLLVTRWLQSS